MSKKIKVFLFLIVLIFSAGIASAVTTFDSDGVDTDSALLDNFRTSKNVELNALGNTTTYAAVSGHLQGDKEYGSASGDSKIYFQAKTEGAQPSDPSASDSSAFADWSAL